MTADRKEPRDLVAITGASEGIGRELALCYAAAGFDLLLVARRGPLLEDVAATIRSTHGVDVLVHAADLATPQGRASTVERLRREKDRIFALVNNAGLGALGWFHDVEMARHATLIDVNIVALTELSHAVLPWLRARGRGHIMQMASVASFQPGPLMATYYASKAYVLSLSEALRNECLGTGVTVTAVCPGPTVTGFPRVAGVAPGAPAGGAPAMDAEDVARIAFEGAMRGKRVVPTGFRNHLAVFIGRFFPRGLTARLVRKIQMRRMVHQK